MSRNCKKEVRISSEKNNKRCETFFFSGLRFMKIWTLFFSPGESFFLPWENVFFSGLKFMKIWTLFFSPGESFFLPWENVFFSGLKFMKIWTLFFSPGESFFSHGKFFFPGLNFSKKIFPNENCNVF